MSALLTIRNDGPGAAEVLVGKSSTLLQPGSDMRVNATLPVSFRALKSLDREEMAQHLGTPISERLRHAEE